MSRYGTATAMRIRDAIDPSAAAEPGTALVPIALARDAIARPAGRARAVFLAHLIATRRAEPQTRTRRRVEPDEAARAYRASGSAPGAGALLSRSL
jgi:hypothetical protein